MIRWLFLVLIIVNLGVFAWGMQRELRPVEPSRGADPNVPSLVLLSELETEGEPTPAASGHSEGQPLSAPRGNPDSPLPEPNAETGSDLDAGENRGLRTLVEAGPDPDSGGIQDAPTQGSGETMPAAEAEPASTGPATEPSLPQAPEADTRESDPGGDAAPREATAAAASAAEPACYSVGPFPKRDDAEGLRGMLEADAVDASVRPQARQEQKGYWVLIPPMTSRAAAVAEVKRIKEKGIVDVWRFNKGEMANAISLGLFARRSQAETHQSDLERRGIGAEIRPRYVEQTVYYVDTGPSPGPELERALAERVDPGFPALTRQTIPCP